MKTNVASFQENIAHGEDSLLVKMCSDIIFLDAVMDGVSTSGEGKHASTYIRKLLGRTNIQSVDCVADALISANSRFYRKTPKWQTTIAAVLYDLGNQKANVVNIGNSSVYLVRDGEVKMLSVPDTVVQMMKDAKYDKLEYQEIDPEKLSRAIGSHQKLKKEHIRIKEVDIQSGDFFLLFTDGYRLREEAIRGALKGDYRLSDIHYQNPANGVEEVVARVDNINSYIAANTKDHAPDDRTLIVRYFSNPNNSVASPYKSTQPLTSSRPTRLDTPILKPATPNQEKNN